MTFKEAICVTLSLLLFRDGEWLLRSRALFDLFCLIVTWRSLNVVYGEVWRRKKSWLKAHLFEKFIPLQSVGIYAGIAGDTILYFVMAIFTPLLRTDYILYKYICALKLQFVWNISIFLATTTISTEWLHDHTAARPRIPSRRLAYSQYSKSGSYACNLRAIPRYVDLECWLLDSFIDTYRHTYIHQHHTYT